MKVATAKKHAIEDYELELRLTSKEAEVLRTLLGWFVVGPQDGPRAATDKIFAALDSADVDRVGDVKQHSKGTVHLLDKPDHL